MPNPNVIVGAIVAIISLAVGAYLAVFIAGGSQEVVLVRAGLITAIWTGPVASLFALFRADQAVQTGVETKHLVQSGLNGHETRIKDLEDKTAS